MATFAHNYHNTSIKLLLRSSLENNLSGVNLQPCTFVMGPPSLPSGYLQDQRVQFLHTKGEHSIIKAQCSHKMKTNCPVARKAKRCPRNQGVKKLQKECTCN